MTALAIKKILLPVNLPATSVAVLQQAVALADRFHSQIVPVHVVTPDNATGSERAADDSLTNSNLLDEVLRSVDDQMDHALRTRLSELVRRSVVVRGDPAGAIVKTAQAEDADLIMMAPHGDMFDEFLLGSVTAKVLRWKGCPVWVGALSEERSAKDASIRNILCAVYLDSRSEVVASWAAQFAGELNAHLTLCNVTPSMAIVSPGGTWANPRYQQVLVDDSMRRLTELQKTLSVKADVLVGIGDVPTAVSEMSKTTKADLLVLDCYPYNGNLRIHGYAVISMVSIPVVSV